MNYVPYIVWIASLACAAYLYHLLVKQVPNTTEKTGTLMLAYGIAGSVCMPMVLWSVTGALLLQIAFAVAWAAATALIIYVAYRTACTA